jgi:hypothetical protein
MELRSWGFLGGSIRYLYIFYWKLLEKYIFNIVVSKENDIFQIAKKPIRDERLVPSELVNEFY